MTTVNVPRRFNAAAYFVDRHVAEGRGADIAIECGDERISYARLLEDVNRAGSALRDQLGVRTEERVAMLQLDTPAFAYVFFGAIKIGAVAVPLNTYWTAAECQAALNDCRARVVVVTAALLPRIAAIPRHELEYLRHVIVADGDGAPWPSLRDLMARADRQIESAPTDRDDAAFWVHSSATTGAPKPCIHLQHDMYVCAELFGRGVLGLTAADRLFSVSKLFFAYGLGNALHFPLAVGGTSVLRPGAAAPADVYATIARHRPTVFFSVPSGYQAMLSCAPHSGDYDLSSVRLAVSAGEALPPLILEAFKDRFGIDILDGLGASETLHVTSNRPGAIRAGSAGLPLPGCDVRLVDDAGHDVAAGQVGSLLVRADSNFAGYWNRHEQTSRTIEGFWVRTGDQCRRDAEGFLWFVGRRDDMIKTGGHWVSPLEVEDALLEHAAVRECGVVGAAGASGLVETVAFVVCRPGVEADAALEGELRHYVRRRLTPYKQPHAVRFVDALPRTATGKLRRAVLRDVAATAQDPRAACGQVQQPS